MSIDIGVNSAEVAAALLDSGFEGDASAAPAVAPVDQPVVPVPTNDQTGNQDTAVLPTADAADVTAPVDKPVDKPVAPVDQKEAVKPDADPKDGVDETAPPTEDKAPDGYVSKKAFHERLKEVSAAKNAAKNEVLALQKKIDELSAKPAARDTSDEDVTDSDDDDYTNPYDDDEPRNPTEAKIKSLEADLQALKAKDFEAEKAAAEEWFGKQIDNLKVEFPKMDVEKVCMELNVRQQEGHKVTLEDLKEHAQLTHLATEQLEQTAVKNYLNAKTSQQNLKVEPVTGDAPSASPFDPGKLSWDAIEDIVSGEFAKIN